MRNGLRPRRTREVRASLSYRTAVSTLILIAFQLVHHSVFICSLCNLEAVLLAYGAKNRPIIIELRETLDSSVCLVLTRERTPMIALSNVSLQAGATLLLHVIENFEDVFERSQAYP